MDNYGFEATEQESGKLVDKLARAYNRFGNRRNGSGRRQSREQEEGIRFGNLFRSEIWYMIEGRTVAAFGVKPCKSTVPHFFSSQCHTVQRTLSQRARRETRGIISAATRVTLGVSAPRRCVISGPCSHTKKLLWAGLYLLRARSSLGAVFLGGKCGG